MPKQSNSTDNAVTASASEAQAPAKQEAEQKYTVEKLRVYCVKLFGVTTSTFDGAMYGHEAESLTVEQARSIIENWLKGGK